MLGDVGALGERVMLNHCVHLSDADIALIAETGTHVIHDPTSNMILASGVSPSRVCAMRASTSGSRATAPRATTGRT